MAMPGRAYWVFGQFVDTTSPTRFQVRQIEALFGTHATATGTIVEGPIPDTHHRITVHGLKQEELNVTDAKITAVDINLRTGFGTITYELDRFVILALSNQAATAIIPKLPEEEIVAENQASMAVCLPDSPEGHSVQGFSAEVGWPEDALGGAVEVQVADILREQAFQTLASINHPKSRYDTPAGISTNFVRLKVTEVSGDGRLTGRIFVK